MRGTPVTFRGFTAGVNLADAPYMLGDKEARDVRNVVATGRGAIRKRDGKAQFAAVGQTVRSVAGVTATTLPHMIVATASGELRVLDTAGVLVGTPVTGLNIGGRWEWAEAPAQGGQGPVYGLNGVDAPRYVSATGAFGLWTAATGSLPNGRWLSWQSNRMLVTGETANPSRVYASKILDPRTFASPDGWAVDLEPSDGKALTGLGSIGPYALVFKPSKVWAIYDLDTGANRRISSSVGCVAPRSIVETPRGTFFLARDGIYITDGNTVTKVSQRVQPLVDKIVPAYRESAAGVYFNGHYYLSISLTGTENSLLLDYDVTLDAWFIHSFGAEQMTTWVPGSDQLLYGAMSNRVDQLFIKGLVQDNGANFEAYWAGPYHAFGAPYLRKRCRVIHLDGSGYVEVAIAPDFAVAPVTVGTLSFATSTSRDTFGGADTFGGSGTFGGGTGGMAQTVGEQKILTPRPGIARTWGIVFRSTADQPFEIDSYTMSMDTRRN